MTATDTGYAPKEWEFDEEVTRVFDDMLERSIPDYRGMRAAVLDFATAFQTGGLWFVDLGTSRGEALAPLVDRFGAQNYYYAAEVSPPMLEAVKDRFLGWEQNGLMRIEAKDLAHDEYPNVPACVVLSVLTLCFIPVEHRQHIIADAYRSLAPGGAMIVVEKVLGSSAMANRILEGAYYRHKKASGYTEDDIARKRLALENRLVPLTVAQNVDLLRAEGFEVEEFWRRLNFVGLLAVKK